MEIPFDKLSKIEVWSNGVVFSTFSEPGDDQWVDAMIAHICSFQWDGQLDPCHHDEIHREENGREYCIACGRVVRQQGLTRR